MNNYKYYQYLYYLQTIRDVLLGYLKNYYQVQITISKAVISFTWNPIEHVLIKAVRFFKYGLRLQALLPC